MSSSYDSPYSLCIFRRRAALLRFSRSLLYIFSSSLFFFFFQAEDGIRDWSVTWSSDVCSSDLPPCGVIRKRRHHLDVVTVALQKFAERDVVRRNPGYFRGVIDAPNNNAHRPRLIFHRL